MIAQVLIEEKKSPNISASRIYGHSPEWIDYIEILISTHEW